ncbi:HNH endonuclease signature motif containing protein [Mycobacterium sp. 236(2023)]|uniref:HNH endonuclease signature motif containing protein n=1 Tax=Mycobacterium sp. 236(2023) TaxID=3038163 RepID=UPI0024153C14|nr:HNH endonuclease signature motif containing protein [Mycobacterium sp. 236(2023)]MDG4665789.1 DUF222 domain-containing protein [Mycobacterium sp. 236(2023)]
MYVRMMSTGELQAKVAALRSAFDDVAAGDVDLLTRHELVSALDELEVLGCQLPSVSHRMLARLQVEATPQQMGAKTWKEVLSVRWRISTSEAHRRLTEASVLAPRQPITGPVLPPVLHATAVAAAQGLINAEHVTVIRKAVAKLPGFVDTVTREQFEVKLVRTAVGNGPKEVKESAELMLFLMDQDGPEPDDIKRGRKRGVTKHKQRDDGMIDVSATFTPEAWAVWEPIFAKYAAPGMCNPDDPEPCTSGTPSQEQIDNDHRTLFQRQHDAIVVVGRIALMSGDLGQLNGLPVTVIIRTTLQDLESRAGVGVTGGGTKLPIADVVKMAGHSNCHLAVFDKATGSALELFRARRVASPAQRIMLIARDGGCTKPGCTIGAYGSQAHHVVTDWIKGGNTNVDELGLACGRDNRSVTDGGWTTTMNERHEVEWIPPEPLDTGQARINNYHVPERLLRPEDTEPEQHSASVADTGAAASPDNDPETEGPRPSDNPGEPGGPAPPDNQVA